VDLGLKENEKMAELVVGDPAKQPVYEVIKREDLTAAFKDAMETKLQFIIAQLEQLIQTYAATAPASLWTWDYTSRWDYDMWQ